MRVEKTAKPTSTLLVSLTWASRPNDPFWRDVRVRFAGFPAVVYSQERASTLYRLVPGAALGPDGSSGFGFGTCTHPCRPGLQECFAARHGTRVSRRHDNPVPVGGAPRMRLGDANVAAKFPQPPPLLPQLFLLPL